MAFLWNAVEAVASPVVGAVTNLVGSGAIVSTLIINYFLSNYCKRARQFASFESETSVYFTLVSEWMKSNLPSRESQPKFNKAGIDNFSASATNV